MSSRCIGISGYELHVKRIGLLSEGAWLVEKGGGGGGGAIAPPACVGCRIGGAKSKETTLYLQNVGVLGC